MTLFLLVTFLVTLVGTTIIGFRLTRAGLRTRQAPELVYGISLLLSALSSIVRLVVQGILGGGEAYHGWMLVSGVLRFATLLTLTWGIRVIFRRTEAWAWPVMALLWLGGAVGLWVVYSYPGGFAEAGPWYQFGDFLPGFATLWGAVESFAYYGRMRRRLALGLADPVITERFRIWGIGFSCAVGAVVVLVAGSWGTGAPITEAPGLLFLVQLLMAAMTVATWFAFYPPEFLSQRVRAQAAAARPATKDGA